jgi:2-C-methyl-D-erythritol 2,4-cyclodiphosphate synthase
VAHSDGDALIHALIDALLGAAGLEDIGAHFPPDDPEYRGISSRILLRKTVEKVRASGYRIGNVDCTVVLEVPRLRPYIPEIRGNLAEDLGVEPQAVSVKAKTKEGLDSVGEGRAIEAYSVALIERRTEGDEPGGQSSKASRPTGKRSI